MDDMHRSRTDRVSRGLLIDAVQHAIAAPSVHNTQPWRFRLRSNGVDVLVDRGRQLRTLDPQGREMYVSVGAAVLNLRLALRARGWRIETSLIPDGGNADTAARVVVVAPEPAPAGAKALAAAIGLRHTNRRPFTGTPVPEHTVAELAQAATAEGADLVVATGALRDGVINLTRTADNRMRANGHYREELAAWTTASGLGRRDGIPREAFGPRDVDTALPLRDLALAHGTGTTLVEFEDEPLIGLLFTQGDSEVDWLRAGAALQRVWLTATVRGLALTPLTQLTEVPPLRGLVAAANGQRVVQTVVRIGFPAMPAVATPRRAVSEVLVD